MDCSPPGSSVHEILQARILAWVAMPFSRGSSWPRDQTCISWSSWIAGWFFTTEPLGKPMVYSSLVYIMALYSSTLAWKIPRTEEPGRLQSMGSLRVGHDWATSLSLFTFMHWRRKWQPIQCSCLENPRDGGAWSAAVYGVAQSRTRLKQLSSSSSSSINLRFSCFSQYRIHLQCGIPSGMHETRVQSLGQEDPLEKEMAKKEGKNSRDLM